MGSHYVPLPLQWWTHDQIYSDTKTRDWTHKQPPWSEFFSFTTACLLLRYKHIFCKKYVESQNWLTVPSQRSNSPKVLSPSVHAAFIISPHLIYFIITPSPQNRALKSSDIMLDGQRKEIKVWHWGLIQKITPKKKKSSIEQTRTGTLSLASCSSSGCARLSFWCRLGWHSDLTREIYRVSLAADRLGLPPVLRLDKSGQAFLLSVS